MSRENVFINGRRITDIYLIPLVPIVDKERAAFIRQLRVEEDYSYRAVAEACTSSWGLEGNDNQIVGMNLCAIAAEYFDEDWDKEPW